MLTCQIENHDEGQILGCCVKQDCQHQRPYCQYCMITLHFDHLQQLKSFKQLNEWISQKMKSYDQLMNVIQQIRISINTIYEIVSPLCFYPLNNFQQLSYSQLNEQIIKVMKIEFTEGVGGMIFNINDLNERLNALCCKFKYLKSFPISQTNFQEQIPGSKQQSVIISQLEKQSQEMSEKLFVLFSHDYKDGKIELENNGKKAINSFLGWRIAICEPKIPKKNCPIYFSFKIINASASDIGVCHRDKIIKDNYQPDLVKEAHGAYLINQQGFVYSNFKANINNQKQSFTFKNNDTITVEVNYKKQIIVWTNQTSKNQFGMQFDVTGDLYPCVGINYGEILTIQHD